MKTQKHSERLRVKPAMTAITLLLALLLFSCKSATVYVPVESLKTEYKERERREYVYLHDSTVHKMRNDTVFLEKYKILFRDRSLRDSIYVRDSIAVPYPVIEYKEVNRLSGWQNFQLWLGRGLLLSVISGIAIFLIKRKLL